MKIGPFFYIRGHLIYNTCTLSEGRVQAGKIDNSYGHDRLFDAYFARGDYIDYPRGRVVYDTEAKQAIIYIDPCIKEEEVLKKIVKAYDIDSYVVELDEHYHCAKCVGELWDEP